MSTATARKRQDKNIIPMTGGGSAGERISSGNSADAPSVFERLRQFGFEVNLDLSDKQASETVALLDAWELDQQEVKGGRPVIFRDRLAVPSWLVKFDCVTSDQAIAASDEGRAAAKNYDNTSEHNPYPPETALGLAWSDAFMVSAATDGEERASGRLFNRQEMLAQLQAKLADAYAEKRRKKADVERFDAAKATAVKEWRKADSNCEAVAQEIEDLLSGNLQLPLLDDE